MKLASWLGALSVLAASSLSSAWADDHGGLALPRNTTHRHASRAVSDKDAITRFRSAVITGDNIQTFCSMLFISDRAAVAAASCFEPGVAIERYGFITGGNGDHAYLQTRFTGWIPHPNYNPGTFSNNIAIVLFDPLEAGGYNSFAVGAYPAIWPTKVSVHRSIGSGGGWNDLHYWNGGMGDEVACQTGSGLYDANRNDFLCQTVTLASEHHQGCQMPFQYFIAVDGDTVTQAALYSHSSLPGDSGFCTSEVILNYYTNIGNYAPWIAQQIGTQVDLRAVPSSPAPPADVAYKMIEPTVESSANRKVRSIFHQEVYLSYSAPKIEPVMPPVIIPVPISFSMPDLWISMHPSPTTISGSPGMPLRPVVSVGTITTTATMTTTTTTTVKPSTVTRSTTTTQTTTSTVQSTVPVTSTASHTVTSTTSSTTTLTTTATQTSVVVSGNVAVVTATIDATTSSTATLTLTSTVSPLVCPLVTPCPAPGPGTGTTTVTQTTTATSTLVLTSYNFAASGHVETGTGVQAPILATVTVTTTQKADTATVTTTVSAGSNPTTTSTTTVHRLVSATTTIPVKTVTRGPTSTAASTAISMESPPAQPASPPQPWAIAMTIVILVLILLGVGVFLFAWWRWRKRNRRQDDCPYFEINPPAYPPDYDYSQGDVKGHAQTSYTHDVRRSRYNSRGSYVGYY